MPSKWLTSAVTLVVISAAGLLAQQRSVFHSEANYVEVDVVVTDKAGHFVPGLTAADFALSESQKPQRVETFSYIDLPRPGHMGQPEPARVDPELGAPAQSLNGRVYILYFNSGSEMDRMEGRRAGRDFVTHAMQPGDLAAVWDAESVGSELAFTTDKDELLAAIEPVAKNGSSPGQERFVDQTSRLREAVDWLSSIQGRRKSLVLFTGGWPQLALRTTDTPPKSADQSTMRASLIAVDWFTGVRGSQRPAELLNLPSPSDITGRADVHIYTVDTRGLVAAQPIDGSRNVMLPQQLSDRAADQLSQQLSGLGAGIDLLRSISDDTGGLSLVNSNDLVGGFQRIMVDNSQYYVLGYASPHTARDSQFVTIQVKSTRPGLTVRSRKGYVAR